MQLKSEEINYLIYRYLIESGFSHSAFTLSHECGISRLNVRPDQVSPGALVNLLFKGLQYVDVETHISQNGVMKRCSQPISVLEKHLCVFTETEFPPSAQEVPIVRQPSRKERETPFMAKQIPNIKAKLSSDVEPKGPSTEVVAAIERPTGPQADLSSPVRISDDQLTVLQGHSSAIYSCAWNSQGQLVATGSGDSTARIWKITETGAQQIDAEPVVVENVAWSPEDAENIDGGKKNFIITALDWDSTGSFLAAGTSNGTYCVWNQEGKLRYSVSHHSASIFSIKWNPSGTAILCGGEDASVSIADSSTGTLIYSCKSHNGSVMDVDWRDVSTFASCSQDATIKVYKNIPNEANHYQSFEISSIDAHDKEINAIRWSNNAEYLASCSDDKTARIWTVDPSNSLSLLHTLAGHTDGIYTVEWNPNPDLPYPMLATASFDGTIRLWNAQLGVCVRVLARHSKSVYSISFSGNGSFLASGSVDRNVYVWNVQDGALLYQYTCKGGVYDLGWNPRSNLLLVCTTKPNAYLLNVPLDTKEEVEQPVPMSL